MTIPNLFNLTNGHTKNLVYQTQPILLKWMMEVAIFIAECAAKINP